MPDDIGQFGHQGRAHQIEENVGGHYPTDHTAIHREAALDDGQGRAHDGDIQRPHEHAEKEKREDIFSLFFVFKNCQHTCVGGH